MSTFIRPDEAAFIHKYHPLYEGIPDLIKLFAERPLRRRKHRVFSSWVFWRHDGAGEMAMDFGTQAFYERFMRALEDAQQGIEMVVEQHASRHKDHIEPIDEIGSCNDPDELLRMYDGASLGSKYRADIVGRHEIARKLAIASQILCIACADAYENVTNDLTMINLFVGERLFTTPGEKLVVGYVLDPDRYNRLNVSHPVRVSRDTQGRFVWPEGVKGEQRIYGCRTIEYDGRVYYVQTDSRPKPRISAVIKLERGGKLRDRRGLKHVVIAVEEQGALHPATQADAEQFLKIARERLWISPLREERDDSGPNQLSSSAYWAAKITGRLEVTRDHLHIAAPAEHQVTSVDHDLNAEFATDELGHREYRRKAVVRFILPQWFPQALYNIDWSRENEANGK